MEFVPGVREECAHSDDAFDTLVCAITAKAAARGRTHNPEPGEQTRLAATEGWIHIPQGGPG